MLDYVSVLYVFHETYNTKLEFSLTQLQIEYYRSNVIHFEHLAEGFLLCYIFLLNSYSVQFNNNSKP
jgi:hypothetical protein